MVAVEVGVTAVEVIEASTEDLPLQNQSKSVRHGKARYEVEVTEISRKGDGIARVQGFVIFIMNGKVGHKVKVKVEQVGNRSAIATTSDLA